MGINLNTPLSGPFVDDDRRISREGLAALTIASSWNVLVNLVTEVVGVLRVVNGGTGRASLTAHDVLIGNGTTAVTLLSPSTAGFLLTSNGVSADPTFQAPATSGDVVGPASSVDSDIALFNGTTGKLIKDGGTISTLLDGLA